MRNPKKKKWNEIGLRYAIHGIWAAFKSERNLKYCLFAVVMVSILAIWLSTSAVENAILILTIGFVIAAELLNTAIERAVDLSCEDILGKELNKEPLQENAKLAKDIAAGAVLFAAMIALVVGAIIFIPKIINKIG